MSGRGFSERASAALRSRERAPWTRDLVLVAIVLVVTIRAFTEVVPILPRAGNFIDLPLLAALLLAVAVRSAPARMQPDSVGLVALLFLLVGSFSALVNIERVEPGPLALFLYGFLAPIGYYLAAYRLWPAGNTAAMSRVLVWLGLVQLAVVFAIDFPRFADSGNPDEISGTFGENAYQLVFFLIVFSAVLAGIATFERGRTFARVAPFLIALSFIVVMLAQFRALLVTLALATVFVGAMLGLTRKRGVLIAALVMSALALGIAIVASQYPTLKLAPTVEVIVEDPGLLLGRRLELATDIDDLYADDPRFALVGAGPGTYSSRAWRTFAQPYSTSESNVTGEYVRALTGGGTYTTDVSERYVVPRLRVQRSFLGSRALAQPFSSYVALLAEVGMLGFALVVFLYGGALVRSVSLGLRVMRTALPGDPLPALFLGCAVGFFALLQMAVLENWLEVTRVTIIPWVMLAVARKELEARETAAS